MKKLLLALAVLALALPLSAAEPLSLADQEFLDSLRDPDIGIPEALPAQPPPCPTSVACTSPTGPCAISINCTVTNLGQCCTTASGLGLCCVPPKSIWVRSCPCAGSGCPPAQVTWGCR